MKKQIFAIFTRTPLHVGAGNSVGAIDSPVMRERHTRIPIIPGSSLKGVLADLWNDENFKRTSDGEELFGKTDSKAAKAGQLLVGESRVLAFPVRSAKGSFAWISCPAGTAAAGARCRCGTERGSIRWSERGSMLGSFRRDNTQWKPGGA